MSALFYVARNGEVIGKFTEEELRAKICKGEFGASDWYLGEGLDNWVRISDYPVNGTWDNPLRRENDASLSTSNSEVIGDEKGAVTGVHRQAFASL